MRRIELVRLAPWDLDLERATVAIRQPQEIHRATQPAKTALTPANGTLNLT